MRQQKTKLRDTVLGVQALLEVENCGCVCTLPPALLGSPHLIGSYVYSNLQRLSGGGDEYGGQHGGINFG